MEPIKKYFSNWDAARIIRLVLGAAMGIGYFATSETLYLMGAIFLLTQAAFNIGCPGGACTTNTTDTTTEQKPTMTFKKYEQKK